MRSHVRVAVASAAVALFTLVFLSCEDAEHVLISVSGVPPTGVEGTITRLETEDRVVTISLREAGNKQGGSNTEVTVRVEGLESRQFPDLPWEQVDRLKAWRRFSPAGPSTRLQLTHAERPVLIIADNSDGRGLADFGITLEAGGRQAPGDEGVESPAPGRVFADGVLVFSDGSRVDAETLEPQELELDGEQWYFVLLSASTGAKDGVTAQGTAAEAPGEVEPRAELQGDGTLDNRAFYADWIMYRVE